MPSIGVKEDTLVRGQKLMKYGDSWDSLINRMMDLFEEQKAGDKNE